ncbi:iron-containing alcohol dehydrogenase [Clostridium culturomicium]|uniref:iron-containing alcohol dehydrogenase n=1 Tax=Clostridium culturomicium TaxID=1499683 RepID=UPI0038579896
MINFDFYNPTRVIFGKETENNVGEICKGYGYKSVLVVYGGGSAKKSGLLDRIFISLKESGVSYCEIGGVVPNPRVQLVREAVALAKENSVDFILGVGGGSVLDTAKAAAMALANDCDPWDIYSKKIAPVTALPVGAVLTIAAAGSETSNSSVITEDETGLKRGYGHDCIRPVFAIMNPELTYTLPAYQTASGVVDIMMHTMERYFTPTLDVELTDRLSEGLLVTVMENAIKLVKNPKDYSARAEIMWAGSISHNGLMGTGRVTDFASHQIEHELSGMFDVAHGAGLAAIWGSWARYVYKENVGRFAQFAVRVMGCEMDFQCPENTALRGIEKIEDFFRSINMPTSLYELGIKEISEEQIEEMAYKCTFKDTRVIGGFKTLKKEDIMAIYNMAKGI